MDFSPVDKNDFIVRTRNVLWREVARAGGSKELARAHVNLPGEAVKALELESKGDSVAFIIRIGSNNVILTNLFESQRSTTTWEKDPQIMLESLLTQVMALKSEKMDAYERWENGELDDVKFTKLSQDMRSRLNGLTSSLKTIQDTYFRSSEDKTSFFINEKTQTDYSDYANSLLDYSESVSSKISSTKKYLSALDSALSKGLVSKLEYQEEKEDANSLLMFLKSTADKAVQILTR